MCKYVIPAFRSMLPLLAAAVDALAGQMFNFQQQAMFSLGPRGQRHTEIQRFISGEPLYEAAPDGVADFQRLYADLDAYFRSAQAHIRAIDICSETVITKNPGLRYHVPSRGGYNVSDFLAFRLQLDDYLISAPDAIEAFDNASFVFSSFESFESGVQQSFGEYYQLPVSEHIGGHDQYLCVFVDISALPSTVLRVLRQMLEMLEKATLVKVLIVGEDVQLVSDYVRVDALDVESMEYKQQNYSLSDDDIYNILIVEQQRFQALQHRIYFSDKWKSLTPKMLAVLISPGIILAASRPFSPLGIPFSIIAVNDEFISETGNATRQKMYADLCYFAQRNEFNLVEYRSGNSDYMNERLLNWQDVGRPYILYCKSHFDAPAPQFFQFSDSVVETMQDSEAIQEMVDIYQALRYLSSMGHDVKFFSIEDDILVASTPLFKKLDNRGETLVGFLSIGMKITTSAFLVFNGNVVCGSSKLEALLEKNDGLYNRLRNAGQNRQNFFVYDSCKRPMLVNLVPVASNLSALFITSAVAAKYLVSQEAYDEDFECSYVFLSLSYCQAGNLYFSFRAKPSQEDGPYQPDDWYRRRAKTLLDYYLLRRDDLEYLSVLCTSDQRVCISDSELALFDIDFAYEAEDCQGYSVLGNYADSDSFLLKRQISSNFYGKLPFDLPLFSEYAVIPYDSWKLAEQARLSGYTMAFVSNNLEIVFLEQDDDQLDYETTSAQKELLLTILRENDMIDQETNQLSKEALNSQYFVPLEMPLCTGGVVYLQPLFETHITLYYTNLVILCSLESQEALSAKTSNLKEQLLSKMIFREELFFYQLEKCYFNTSFSRYDDQPDETAFQIQQAVTVAKPERLLVLTLLPVISALCFLAVGVFIGSFQ